MNLAFINLFTDNDIESIRVNFLAANQSTLPIPLRQAKILGIASMGRQGTSHDRKDGKFLYGSTSAR